MTTTYDKDGAYIEVTTDGVVHRRSIKWEDCVVSFPTATKLKIDRTYINDSDQLVLVLTDESEITLSASDEITIHAADVDAHHAKYTDSEAKAAAVLAGAITDGETKAPTHDAVYDVKVVADAAQTAAEVDDDIATHAGLTNPHTVYILHSLATAVSDFIVASGAGVFVKKTLAEVKTALGLGTAAYTAATDYVTHALATAASDFLVASGSGAYIKKTLVETLTILGKAAASGLASLNASSKVVQQPASITDHLDGSPDEDDATKAPTSEWAFDHAALDAAHGAVSAATASKIVIRDAAARAKFAAPGAAGDVLIKGTALTITEMAALTTGKIWQGVANRPSEVDLPSAGATLTVAETEAFPSGYAPNNTWTDLDLHTIVGANKALVWLKVTNGVASARAVSFRINGDTEPTISYEGTFSALVPASHIIYLMCCTDANGIVEWSGGSASQTTTLDVVAYIK